jgi:hypothetical protein
MHRHQWNSFVANVKLKMSFTSLEQKQIRIDQRTFDSNGACLFCKLALGDVIYRDSEVVVFKDIKEDARCHLLVIPTQHIPNILHLTSSHIPLIHKMQEIGKTVLSTFGDGDHVLGFHHPPINSIDHLHMHAILKPIFHLKSKLSYSKYLWFITPDQVISRLEAVNK